MNLKRLSAKYDCLYEKADKLFKEHNPCLFIDGLCICNRKVSTKRQRHSGGCCGGCKYVGSKGCTVKSLGCKLFVCDHIYLNYKTLYEKIYKLGQKAVMKDFSLGQYYLSKEDVFRQIREDNEREQRRLMKHG